MRKDKRRAGMIIGIIAIIVLIGSCAWTLGMFDRRDPVGDVITLAPAESTR